MGRQAVNKGNEKEATEVISAQLQDAEFYREGTEFGNAVGGVKQVTPYVTALKAGTDISFRPSVFAGKLTVIGTPPLNFRIEVVNETGTIDTIVVTNPANFGQFTVDVCNVSGILFGGKLDCTFMLTGYLIPIKTG